MNLTTLTHRDALCLNARFASRDEAITALAQRLTALGKIADPQAFLTEVFPAKVSVPPRWAKDWQYRTVKRPL